MYKREIWKSNENNKPTFQAFFFFFQKAGGGKAATSGDLSPCTATSSRSFVQEEGSETARAGSFTATPRSGVDSCDAVRNQMVCAAAAAAPAELRTTGEELGNPSLKARKQADAGVRETRSRALPDRSQEGRDYKRGKKMSCHTCTGGRREHADKLQMHLAPEGLERSRASTPTLEKLGRKATFLHSPTHHIAGLSGGTEWPLPSRKPFRFKRSVNILSYVCTGRR